MTWVRRTEKPRETHKCQPPCREMVWELPRVHSGDTPVEHREWRPDGLVGDLWRCDDCGALWTVVERCAVCRERGHHPGHVTREVTWEPASWWQRFKHRNDGRNPREYTQADVDRLNAEVDG